MCTPICSRKLFYMYISATKHMSFVCVMFTKPIHQNTLVNDIAVSFKVTPKCGTLY